MHLLEVYIKQFLSKVNSGKYKIPLKVLEEITTKIGISLQKQFERTSQFSLRMSNIGKPICQLQWEQAGYSQNAIDIFRGFYGEVLEHLMMFILKEAGVPIIASQQEVTYKIGGIDLKGHFDLIIEFTEGDKRVWDIKTASEWSFNNKFSKGFEEISKNDDYGYVQQLFLYATAAGCKAGGFIVINKSSGAISIVPAPEEQRFLTDAICRSVEEKILKLYSLSENDRSEQSTVNTEISRQIEIDRLDPVREVFRKKETGRLLAPFICTMCQHKFKCWPDIHLDKNELSVTEKLNWYVNKK